jgi:signal transduction histidine kinase
MAARSGVIGGQTRVEPVVKALVRALNRIYQGRKLTLRLDCPEDAAFHGERHDLEEMVGNLLDNACKWAKSDISLTVSVVKENIVITVDDDGPGLPEKERLAAIKRGRRLDETKPGSGLGLSIVAELAHLYKGRLFLEKSEQSGLRAHLELPGS